MIAEPTLPGAIDGRPLSPSDLFAAGVAPHTNAHPMLLFSQEVLLTIAAGLRPLPCSPT